MHTFTSWIKQRKRLIAFLCFLALLTNSEMERIDRQNTQKMKYAHVERYEW